MATDIISSLTEQPSQAGTYHSQWKTEQPSSLTRNSFLDLLAGQIPLIKISDFVPRKTCQQLVQQLEPQFSPYLHATGPPVDKVGLAQFEFQAQFQEDMANRQGQEQQQRYFDEAGRIASLHDDLAATIGTNVWKTVIESLAALVPEWDFEVATEPSRNHQQYFSGIFRRINNGTPPHCDWCPYDVPAEENWILSKIICQAVFNLYLSPVQGGNTTLYDVQWTEEALKYRDPNSYGYYHELVDGRPRCTFTVDVGQLCIFNSRNIHEVQPVQNASEQPRIALASFMGVLPSDVTGGRPKLIFWS